MIPRRKVINYAYSRSKSVETVNHEMFCYLCLFGMRSMARTSIEYGSTNTQGKAVYRKLAHLGGIKTNLALMLLLVPLVLLPTKSMMFE